MILLGPVLKPIKPRQRDNEWILKVYAAALLGLVFFFVGVRWVGYVVGRYRWSRIPSLRIAVTASRLEHSLQSPELTTR